MLYVNTMKSIDVSILQSKFDAIIRTYARHWIANWIAQWKLSVSNLQILTAFAFAA